MEWIIVKDRLPDERKAVLVYCFDSERMLVSEWFCWFPERRDKPLWHNVMKEDGPVTHWSPIEKPEL